MDEKAKQKIIESYRDLFLRHEDRPEAVQYSSPKGQRFRFEKLMEIADLGGRHILDLGCGLGHLYPFLLAKFGEVDYTGIDIVPEVIAFAAQKYPHARFLCRDILQEDIDEDFDYVLICGVFNNAIPDCTVFLQEMISAAFRHCKMGLGFNFISTHVNFTDGEMAYHDPAGVFDFCLDNLSRKVIVYHHYERCDVAIFVYR